MKSLIALAGIVGTLGVLVSCGDDERPKDIGSGASSARAGTPGLGGSGKGGNPNNVGGAGAGDASGGDGQGGAGALRLSITSPSAATDPGEDDVLVADDVVVKCLARASDEGDQINPSTVKIAVLSEDGVVLTGVDDEPLEQTAAPTGMTDEYSAEISLVAVPSGVVAFRCTATGTDASVKGSTTLPSLVDHGPTIVQKLPAIDSAHALDSALDVEFSVTPTPLGEDDEEAALASVELFVAGVAIPAKEDSESPGTYRASVNFQDPLLFDEPPTEHTSVRIEATNKRTAVAATAILDYPFVVDGKPPVITIESPVDNAAVKGETVVEFTAVDTGAGVDEDRLEVILNNGTPIKYDATDKGRWNLKAKDTYTFRFDTAEVGQASAQIAVAINATDRAGIPNGASLFLWLDNVPPIVDLDPGNWRVRSATDCSASFDPLGTALNDGDALSAFAKIRALVYDVTKNTGQPVDYPALADRKSAKLYAQIDTTQPFLIDTGTDGICDSLARDDFPFSELGPVTVQGTPLNSDTDFATAPAITPNVTCKVTQAAIPEPASLCGDESDLHVVVQHDVRGVVEPIVYGMGGLTGLECTGSTWNPIAIKETVDGWICYAAVASDNLGNVGFSRPLHVCYDNPNIAGSPACATGSTTPPSCTDGCTAPVFPAHIYRKP